MISKNQLKLVRLLEQKKYRRREGLFVAEGTKVVGDLLERFKPQAVFATPDWQAPEGIMPQTVTPDELQRLSFQQHPQQVLALFPMPEPVATPTVEGLTLALDGFDILGNLSNISQVLNSQGRTETYRNSLPRYVMLHAIYRLNIKPKKR